MYMVHAGPKLPGSRAYSRSVWSAPPRGAVDSVERGWQKDGAKESLLFSSFCPHFFASFSGSELSLDGRYLPKHGRGAHLGHLWREMQPTTSIVIHPPAQEGGAFLSSSLIAQGPVFTKIFIQLP